MVTCARTPRHTHAAPRRHLPQEARTHARERVADVVEPDGRPGVGPVLWKAQHAGKVAACGARHCVGCGERGGTRQHAGHAPASVRPSAWHGSHAAPTLLLCTPIPGNAARGSTPGRFVRVRFHARVLYHLLHRQRTRWPGDLWRLWLPGACIPRVRSCRLPGGGLLLHWLLGWHLCRRVVRALLAARCSRSSTAVLSPGRVLAWAAEERGRVEREVKRESTQLRAQSVHRLHRARERASWRANAHELRARCSKSKRARARAALSGEESYHSSEPSSESQSSELVEESVW